VTTLDHDALAALRHDTRSPLVVIGGFARLLAADKPLTDAERREYAEGILHAAEDLSALVDRALGD